MSNMYAPLRPTDDTDAHPLLPSATRHDTDVQLRSQRGAIESCCDNSEGMLGLIFIVGFEGFVAYTLHTSNAAPVHAACGGLWAIVLAHLVVPLVIIFGSCSIGCMQCTVKLAPFHQDRLSFLFTGVVAICCAVLGSCGYSSVVSNNTPTCSAAAPNLIYVLYVYLVVDAILLAIIAILVLLRSCVSSWTADGHI